MGSCDGPRSCDRCQRAVVQSSDSAMDRPFRMVGRRCDGDRVANGGWPGYHRLVGVECTATTRDSPMAGDAGRAVSESQAAALGQACQSRLALSQDAFPRTTAVGSSRASRVRRRWHRRQSSAPPSGAAAMPDRTATVGGPATMRNKPTRWLPRTELPHAAVPEGGGGGDQARYRIAKAREPPAGTPVHPRSRVLKLRIPAASWLAEGHAYRSLGAPPQEGPMLSGPFGRRP